MPRNYRNQKEREQFLIREFAEHCGDSISNPKWPERPNALLTLRNNQGKKRIAIEHTDYYNDTTAGLLSPVTPIGEFWRLVLSSIVRRISHRKDLIGTHGGVRFNNNLVFPRKQNLGQIEAKQLAEEIVDFVESNPVPKQSTYQLFRRRDFSNYATMANLLSSLTLLRAAHEYHGASRFHWTCSNITAGSIGISMDYIKTSISVKNKKAINYENWGDAKERWLLIVSGGGNVSTHAGPLEQNINWDCPDLAELCLASPFDRIIFWERVRSWLKWLK